MKKPPRALEQLFGGYLHQDYRAEFADLAAAVRAYAKQNPAELARALDELAQLSASARGKSLSAQLAKLGMAYDPGADGLTHEQLLVKIRELLERSR